MVAASLDVSIVIVNYNSKDYLSDCIFSIRNTVKKASHEIIIVDNNSQDGSPEYIRKVFYDSILIANKTNCGLSKACNQGIEISRGRHVLLLNNDTVLLPNAIDDMLAIMDKTPGIGLLGCRLLNSDGSLQQSFGKVINFTNDFARKYFINLYEKHKNPLVGKFLAWTHSTAKEVDWVKGACMLLRREAVLDADMMDDNFFMYMEEVDLGIRVRQLGWKVWYTPDIEIIHRGGGSTSTNSYRASVEYRRSQLYFYKKHYGRNGLIRLRIYLFCKIGVNYLIWLVKGFFVDREDPLYREKGRFLKDVFKLVKDYR